MKKKKFSIIACLVPTVTFDNPCYFHVNTFYYGNFGLSYLCVIDLYYCGSTCYIAVKDNVVDKLFGFKLKPISLDSCSYLSLREKLLNSYLEYYSTYCMFD